MTANFYINSFIYKGKIYYTGYEDGIRVQRKVNYEPYIFLPSDKEGGYRTLDGKPVQKKSFDTIFDAFKFIKEHKTISNFRYFGNTSFLYTWINDTFPGEIDFDISKINVIFIDIEVASDEGFPDFKNPVKEITAITISKRGKKIVFGCGDYTPKSNKVVYYKAKDEKSLLRQFLKVWNMPEYCPDVVTGWNSELFDIPYLYSRIKYLLGEKEANMLSPWRMVEEQERMWQGSRINFYRIMGIEHLDYFFLYKKFTFANHESYSLNSIAHFELGEKKIDYQKEYDNLIRLYKENYELFIDYNVRDVELVEKLEDKMKFIEQVFTLAYMAKVNFLDTLTTVRVWDTIIHNYLLDQYIVVPNDSKSPEKEIVGAFVKEPVPGQYSWVVSVDYTSLYPHLMMQYNISPDSFVKKIEVMQSIDNTIEDILNGNLEKYTKDVPEAADAAITSNLCLYRRDKQGFLAFLMEKIYKDRKMYKGKMLDCEREYEKNPSPDLKKLIKKYDNMQQALKILLNSGYGAVANKYFRFFNADNAEAVTSTGQLAIQWVEKRINKIFNKLLDTKDADYVIASDTDSLYISFDALVKKRWGELSHDEILDKIDSFCKTSIVPYIDKCCEELAKYTNAYQSKLSMKREVIADKGIWTGKKRYILNVLDSEEVRYKEPKLKIKGIEVVRSSTPTICRKTIKEAISIIVNKTEADLIEYVEKFREEFKTLPLDEISRNSTIAGLKQYSDSAKIYGKKCPMQVKGALIYNHYLRRKGLTNSYQEIFEGNKGKYIYLKIPNPLHEEVITFINRIPSEFGIEKYIDYETQFDRTFLAPLRTIANAIGWKLEQTSTLEQWIM